MTKRLIRNHWRLAALGLLTAFLNACAPLSQDELNRLARDSASVRPLAESLARADGGSILSLDDDRFLAEISSATLTREQFLQVLTTHCRSAHAGSLKTSRDNFPLGASDIREFQLQALAGSDGAVSEYLRDTLGRTLNSDISKSERNLAYDGSERYGDKLHRQATVVCASYGDNGLLQVHYMVSYLTTDDGGGGDPVWGVATEGAFSKVLARQRELALAAASRAMSDDQESIVAYKGQGRNGPLAVEATLSRPAPYGFQFEVQLELTNQGGAQVTVSPELAQMRTADGRDWQTAYDGPMRGAGNSCESLSRREIRIGAGETCRYRFVSIIQGFDMPNMMMSARVAETFVKFSPVSEFDRRYGRN